MNKDFKTPLKRARYLGTARSGTDHFRDMHLTSLALLPLSALLVYILVHTLNLNYADAREAFKDPVIAGGVALFVVFSAWHMRLGMESIIEDYVHGEGLKFALLTCNTFFCGLTAFVSLFALLRLNFGL